MNIEIFRDYCLNKKGVTEHFPFDNKTLVFKVGWKMFALCNIENFDSVNLKCDPNWTQELRAQYDEIKPGYHMNKIHWNTVNVTLPSQLFVQLIDHSYELVFNSLTKKIKQEIG